MIMIVLPRLIENALYKRGDKNILQIRTELYTAFFIYVGLLTINTVVYCV